MAKYQALCDRELEKATLDLENAAHEQEELKRLNNQLLAQITALQNTQGPPPSADGPTNTETQDDELTQTRGVVEHPPLLLRNDLTMSLILSSPYKRST